MQKVVEIYFLQHTGVLGINRANSLAYSGPVNGVMKMGRAELMREANDE